MTDEIRDTIRGAIMQFRATYKPRPALPPSGECRHIETNTREVFAMIDQMKRECWFVRDWHHRPNDRLVLIFVKGAPLPPRRRIRVASGSVREGERVKV